MSDKRRGLGRGLGALIPSSAAANASGNGAAPSRPVDLFFPEARKKTSDAEPHPDANATRDKEPKSTPLKADDSADFTVDTTETGSAAAGVTKKAPARKSADSKAPAAAKAAASDASEQLAFDSTPEHGDEGTVDLVEVPGVRFAEIPVTDIHPNRKQPRSV